MANRVVSYLRLNPEELLLNGKPFPLAVEGGSRSPLTGLYEQLQINYPKFHKMDDLCRLGLLAIELLLRNNQTELRDPSKVGLVFSNKASSLDTDRQYAKSISDRAAYFPSPSVFVYTLPNIVIGEIAIKHKWTGENAFFLSEEFDAVSMHRYTEILLEQTAMENIFCGWTDCDHGRWDAFVYWVKKGNFNGPSETFSLPHEAEILGDLFRKK